MALKICKNCIYFDGHCNNFKSSYFEMTMQDDGGCGMFENKDYKKQRSALNSDDLLDITKAFDLDKVNIAKETAIKFIKDKRGKTN